jgi:hypothetical protein
MVIDQRTTSLRGEAQDWESAFQKVTDGCKSCHRDFRARKEAPTISPIKKTPDDSTILYGMRLAILKMIQACRRTPCSKRLS